MKDSMTDKLIKKAELVISDTRMALKEFELAEISQSSQLIRIKSVLCLTLLRATGHVLRQDKSLKEKSMNIIESEKHLLMKFNEIQIYRCSALKEYNFYFSLKELRLSTESFGKIEPYSEDDVVLDYAVKSDLTNEDFTHFIKDGIKFWEEVIKNLKE